MQEFTKEVIGIIQSIPRGKVATYSQIAKMAGRPRSARQVGRILHTLTKKYNLPWYRVIGSTGKILIKNQEIAEQQKFLLRSESIEVNDQNKIDLDRFQWLRA